MGEPRWFHGGVAGLAPGDWLLPRDVTGWVGTTERLHGLGVQIVGMEADRDRGDRVFLTTRRELARAYAWHWATVAGARFGGLYVAVPVPVAEVDPDLPEISVQCERARIISVADPCVVMKTTRCARVMQSVATAPAVFSPGRVSFG